MRGFERLVSNIVFGLLCLLVVLLIFEQHVQIPFWLQPAGRMHPLLLHFPVVLVFLLILISFLKKQIDSNSYQKINRLLLGITALTTTLTAVMGFLLYKEGYDSELMTLHKWLGVLLAFLVYLLTFVEARKLLYYPVLYSTGIIMVLVGHFGAGVTHGSNFLTEPLLAESAPPIDEYTPIFEAFVQPVLDKKCVACHNPDKHKGGLIMTSLSEMVKGGENGPVWEAGDSEGSAIIKRALLPLEHEDHMPPEGKPQLTADEIELISEWIEADADTLVSLATLSDSIPLKSLVYDKWFNKAPEKPLYDFPPADEDLIRELNNPYRTVVQKSPKSPAIDVAIFGQSAFHAESITGLLKIKEQIVSLNLSYLPITDANLDPVAKLVNLEELNLNFTQVTSDGLARLSSCDQLKSLSISGTMVDKGLEKVLRAFPALTTVHLWGTKISDTELQLLQDRFPDIRFVMGFEGNSEEEFQLGAPILSNKSAVLSKGELITLTHKLQDVDIRFTMDGSVPDSTSQLYATPLEFEGNFVLKAKASKEGWKPSDEATFSFFEKGLKPFDIELLSKPNPRNKGQGGITLVDDYIGSQGSMISLAWIGFTDTPLIALADFGESPPQISELMLSHCLIKWQRILPPQSIEVWGGNTKDQLELLKKISVDFGKDAPDFGVSNVSVQFPKSTFRYYKIIATRFKKLPDWHPKKGEEGKLFVDELFFYP
nr:c-type cytochrome domain-containing protein [Allomuricauda sp.]